MIRPLRSVNANLDLISSSSACTAVLAHWIGKALLVLEKLDNHLHCTAFLLALVTHPHQVRQPIANHFRMDFPVILVNQFIFEGILSTNRKTLDPTIIIYLVVVPRGLWGSLSLTGRHTCSNRPGKNTVLYGGVGNNLYTIRHFLAPVVISQRVLMASHQSGDVFDPSSTPTEHYVWVEIGGRASTTHCILIICHLPVLRIVWLLSWNGLVCKYCRCSLIELNWSELFSYSAPLRYVISRSSRSSVE